MISDPAIRRVAKVFPTCIFEDAVCQLDTGEEFFIFCPDLERSFVGRRCLLQLAAFLPRTEVSTTEFAGLLSSEGPTPYEQRFTGKVTGYFLDGVSVDFGFGSIGAHEVIDDRVEVGQRITVSTGRLDFRRVLAVETPGVVEWVPVDPDPFEDPAPALAALRAGHVEPRPMSGEVYEFVNGQLKVVDTKPYSSLTLWGHPVENLVYRFGETDLREAEREVVGFLEHDDIRLRDAALWVLSRHWGMREHSERIMKLAFKADSVKAIIGLGILLRGTGDPNSTQRLIGFLRERKLHWYVREACYLALLGIWLPRTARVRDAWRGWEPWREMAGHTENVDEAWDEEWGTVVRKACWSLNSYNESLVNTDFVTQR